MDALCICLWNPSYSPLISLDIIMIITVERQTSVTDDESPMDVGRWLYGHARIYVDCWIFIPLAALLTFWIYEPYHTAIVPHIFLSLQMLEFFCYSYSFLNQKMPYFKGNAKLNILVLFMNVVSRLSCLTNLYPILSPYTRKNSFRAESKTVQWSSNITYSML